MVRSRRLLWPSTNMFSIAIKAINRESSRSVITLQEITRKLYSHLYFKYKINNYHNVMYIEHTKPHSAKFKFIFDNWQINPSKIISNPLST